ncbi:hypothetical protein [Xylophilus sp.]|uniref:hypothetical protein n=1 Tax=Xylophilus sp. TaxID=2653893 RepID=UPI0013BB9005|nr:hypothetical protein [Xylophilus sp.]KAF1050080.1 MAG: hypothetical protein GAK38_00105 [Xylophilus sp.]
MRLLRTDKATLEIRSNVRTLTLAERSVLFLADGSRTADDIAAAWSKGDCAAMLASLVERGYLQAEPQAMPAASPPPPPPAIPVATAADAFGGRRSLAAARMFLFDLCERFFARRDPALAAALRDRLRNARDRAEMLRVADELLQRIEEAADSDRAQSVRVRLDALLPREEATALP